MIAAALAVVFTAGCISSAEAALSRKPQDNIFYATSTDPLGLDPALVDDNDSGKIIGNIYESLLRFKNSNTEVEPQLAESYEISPDGLSYTFKLRQGVKFHDGTPFNAEAVKFNIDRQMPENLVPKMSYAGLVYGDVKSTEVIDEYTVRINLKKPSTPFLHNMAMLYSAPMASPTALKKYNNNLMQNPCGTKNPITKDKDVRRALSMAINVPEMVATLYKGYATPANTLLPPFVPGYSPDVKQVQYNPQEAAKILKEKGVSTIKILTYTGARFYNPVGGQVLAEAVQSYFDKVGVKAEVLAYDWATYKNKLATDEWDIGFMGWTGDNGDPDNFLNLFASDDPINNNGLWYNDEYRALIAKGVELKDGPERNELYHKAEQIMADEAALLPISHAQVIAAYRPNIKNFSVHQVGMTFFKDVVKE